MLIIQLTLTKQSVSESAMINVNAEALQHYRNKTRLENGLQFIFNGFREIETKKLCYIILILNIEVLEKHTCVKTYFNYRNRNLE